MQHKVTGYPRVYARHCTTAFVISWGTSYEESLSVSTAAGRRVYESNCCTRTMQVKVETLLSKQWLCRWTVSRKDGQHYYAPFNQFQNMFTEIISPKIWCIVNTKELCFVISCKCYQTNFSLTYLHKSMDNIHGSPYFVLDCMAVSH